MPPRGHSRPVHIWRRSRAGPEQRFADGFGDVAQAAYDGARIGSLNQCLAHLHVGQYAAGCLEESHKRGGRRKAGNIHAAFVAETRRHAIEACHGIDIALLESRYHSVLAAESAEHVAVQLGGSAGVVSERFQGYQADRLVGIGCRVGLDGLPGEGPCSYRSRGIEGSRAHLGCGHIFQDMFRHDTADQVVRKGGERVGQRERYRQFVVGGHGDVLPALQQRRTDVGVLDEMVGERHVVGGQRRAVLPGQPGLERDGVVLAGRVDGHAAGQITDQLVLIVILHQACENQS